MSNDQGTNQPGTNWPEANQPDDDYDEDLHEEADPTIPTAQVRLPPRPPLDRVTKISGFLQKPPIFSGQGATRFEDWEQWTRKLKFYLATVNPEYERLLNYAEQSTTPIASNNYAPSHLDTLTTDEMKIMSADVRQTLFSFTTGAALVKLNAYSEKTTDGFELWRLLAVDFKMKDRDKARKLLRDIMAYHFDENNFEESLLFWETMIAKYERTTMIPLPDEVKISTVLGSTTGPLFEHLTLNADHYTTYNEVRRRILDWHRTRTLLTEDTTTTTNAMYRDYHGQKGKGKWTSHYGDYHRDHYRSRSKGKGKKGKGKGKTKGKYYKGKMMPRYYKGKGKRTKGKSKGKGKRRKGKGKGNYYGKNNYSTYNNNNGLLQSTTGLQQHDSNTPMDIGAVPTGTDEYWYDYDDERNVQRLLWSERKRQVDVALR